MFSFVYGNFRKVKTIGFFERLFSFAAASSSLKGEVRVTGHLVVILISQNSKEYLGEM